MRRWANYNGIYLAYPDDTGSDEPTTPTLDLTAGLRDITVTLGNAAAGDAIAWIVHRATSGSFPTQLSNTIYIIALDGTNDVTFVDGPLDPGTYYYNAGALLKDGTIGMDIGEENTTIS